MGLGKIFTGAAGPQIERPRRKPRDERDYDYRYIGRCRYYSYDYDICTVNSPWSVQSKCMGPCRWYEAISEEEFEKRRKENRKNKMKESASSGTTESSSESVPEVNSAEHRRRYKGRCRFYSYDGDRCRCKSSSCYKSKCKGSGGCAEYYPVTEGAFRKRQKAARNMKKCQSGGVRNG